MENKLKLGLFLLLFILLFLPVMQQSCSLFPGGKLYGFATFAPPAQLSANNWWTCSYQGAEGNFLNDHMGFRPALIKVNNQLDYSLFGKTHCKWNVVLGKDHCIFQADYIYSYNGGDYIGYAGMLSKLAKVKAIQDTLAHLGKSLILIHAPCKAFFYPENIPDQNKTTQKLPTNFATFLRIGDSLGINQVNFNSWFASMKSKSPEVLYTKQGVHWSVYGSLIAADSLARYVELLRHIHMPHPVWNHITHTTKARGADDDLAKTFNLLVPYTTEIFSYPDVSYHADATMTRPKIVYIGDSFLEAWINDGIMENTNSDWQVMWNKELTMDKSISAQELQRTFATYDLVTEMKNRDCVVLLYTSRDLVRFGDGFIEKAYDHYYPDGVH